jgi:DNA-binding CsgD family transcriptional regulator
MARSSDETYDLSGDGTLHQQILQQLNDLSEQEPPAEPPPQGFEQGLQLLQGVMNALIDGVMILTQQGKVLEANSAARFIYQQIGQDPDRPNDLPQPVWEICQSLVQMTDSLPDTSTTNLIAEDEIRTDTTAFRVRVGWMLLSDDRRYLLVTLEDQSQSTTQRALSDARTFGLTNRETQVWLLKQAGYSYKAIATELKIAEDAVKRHIKRIYAKRAAVDPTTESAS